MDQKLFKVVLVGDAKVGKTNLMGRVAQGPDGFQNTYTESVGADYKTKKFEDQNTQVQLWDLAGGKGSIALTGQFVRGSDAIGILLEGNNSKQDQTTSVTKWFDFIKKEFGDELPPVYFVVSKSDILTKEQKDTCTEAVREWNTEHERYVQLRFCSAKTGEGVDELFNEIVDECLKRSANPKKKVKEEIEYDDEIVASVFPSPSPKNTSWISNHIVWIGGNVLFAVALVTLLAIALSPIGGMFALGALSGAATVGIIGVTALFLWNVGCVVGNFLMDLWNVHRVSQLAPMDHRDRDDPVVVAKEKERDPSYGNKVVQQQPADKKDENEDNENTQNEQKKPEGDNMDHLVL